MMNQYSVHNKEKEGHGFWCLLRFLLRSFVPIHVQHNGELMNEQNVFVLELRLTVVIPFFHFQNI